MPIVTDTSLPALEALARATGSLLPETLISPAYGGLAEGPAPDTTKDLEYLAARMVKQAPPDLGAYHRHQSSVALLASVLRVLGTCSIPQDLTGQLPPLLRSLHVANVTGRGSQAVAIKLDGLLDQVGEGLLEAGQGTLRGLMQAQREITCLQEVWPRRSTAAPARNVLAPQVVNLIGLTSAAASNPGADAGVLQALRAIACNALVLAVKAGGEEAAAPMRDAVQGLVDKLTDVATGRVGLGGASSAIGSWLSILVRTFQDHNDGDALGCLDGLFSMASDLGTLTAVATERLIQAETSQAQ